MTDIPTVPLLDVPRGNAPLRDEILAAITIVVDSGRFLFGPDVQKLEAECARRSGTKHGVGCASGSDALLLSLMALDIKPGDEVICPSFTFFATASPVSRLGATPVFVDIDPVTFNIDPAALEAAITPNTKAVIPVHLFGQCADMPRIMEICNRTGLAVIEDAAQAIGANIEGRPAGSWGQVGCISFYPTKNLGGFGDGGMLITNDADFEDRLRLFAGHGMRPRYHHQVIGINSRLDTIQAATLNVKMKHLESANKARQQNAQLYEALFDDAGLEADIVLPQAIYGTGHVWNQYTVRVKNDQRDSLKEFLAERNIGAEIYYPIPVHAQECYQSRPNIAMDLTETNRAADEVLSLPIFPELEEAEIQAVVAGVTSFYSMTQSQAA
ncbi:MAG TPA: DegT/DnrJ/EryC1/StrS family aminotransferase [Planctomycetes bacterium]|nr:DegT/DnrJ/EryC1/StrS family aminotransferase [Planctomycetaceae bacterium]HIN53423.1 DegT/DnrJ/EryC1/StrS family aminotransferase [Planctomycetota bacterium]